MLYFLLFSYATASGYDLYPHYQLYPYNAPYRDYGEIKYENQCARCVLPPFPKNGCYKALEPGFTIISPGNPSSCFVLEFECYAGYHKTTDSLFTCYENGNTLGTIPKCLPLCKEEGDGVLSCGAGWYAAEAQCISPRQWGNNVLTRYTPMDAVDDNKNDAKEDEIDEKVNKDDAKQDQVNEKVNKDDAKQDQVNEKVNKDDAKEDQVGDVDDKNDTDVKEDANTKNANINLSDPTQCGYHSAKVYASVAGGAPVEPEELPWHAGIYTKTTSPYMQICGGSLVSDTVVISAAHCFWSEVEKKLPASDFAVAVGKIYRPWNDPQDKNAQKSDVAEIKFPPRFRGIVTNLQDDIALVVVSTPFTYSTAVIHVCLNFDAKKDKQALTGGRGKVAGWGLTSEDGLASPVLQVVNLPVVPIDKCIDDSDPTFKPFITRDKICAGFRNGTAVCKGDSGGGFAFENFDLKTFKIRYDLRGVVSAAPPSDHLCNVLAWAAFTHVLDHEEFIRETVTVSTNTK